MEFSLKWFKERIKSTTDKIVEKRVDQAANSLALEETLESKPERKLYKVVKLVNNTLTVVLEDGRIFTKNNATRKDYEDATNCTDMSELQYIMSTPEAIQEEKTKEIEVKKIQDFNKGLDSLRQSPDFVFEDSCVYMKGVKRSLPELLVTRFAEVLGSLGKDSIEYQSLKKFWLKCCLNPNAKSAEDLYAFLAHHRFKIDNHGNFYAYRRVVSKGTENQKLVEFVSNAYTKIKAVWKKKPSDYEVVNRPETGLAFHHIDSAISGELLGNLEKLYLELPNMQKKTYTSAHTGKEDYRIGEVISMPRNDGDDNNNVSCSKGFHAASKAYDYSGFGDTPILVIINPMDVLAVPKGEWGKLRTCRWFFATTLQEDEKYILDDEDYSVAELGDIFEQKCAIDLEEHVKQSFAEEVKRHTFTLSMIDSKEINTIVNTLDDMRRAISTRVKEMA